MMLLTKANREALPALYSNENKAASEIPVVVKFFTPDSNWTWYATEFNGEDTFFGFVIGFEGELGYFSLSEIQGARGPLGLAIERDRHFGPASLEDVQQAHAEGHSL